MRKCRVCYVYQTFSGLMNYYVIFLIELIFQLDLIRKDKRYRKSLFSFPSDSQSHITDAVLFIYQVKICILVLSELLENDDDTMKLKLIW